ncbi:MAG: hypothetical protein ACR2RV_25745 [Verrucomicrobiales bacterium]
MMNPLQMVIVWTVLFCLPVEGVERITLGFEPDRDIPYSPSSDLRGFLVQGRDTVYPSRTNQFGNLPQNGTYFVSVGNYGSPLLFEHADGDTFAANAIDLAEYSSSVPTENVVAEFSASFADGSTDSVQFALDGVIDGEGPLEDFETFEFPDHWTGLVALSLSPGLLAFDNLVITGHVVPEVAPLDGFAPLADARVIAPLPAVSRNQSWAITGIDDHGIRFALAEYGRIIHRGGQQLLVSHDGAVKRGSRADDLVAGVRFLVEEGLDDEDIPTLRNEAGAPQRLVDTDGVSSIDHYSQARTTGGEVAVLNHWYQDDERYAVFVITPDALTAIALPDTVLPDGGVPYSFPGELYFDDGAVAFDSSSSLEPQRDRWFVHFPDNGIRLGLAEGDFLPGTEVAITQIGRLLDLGGDFARFEVRTDRSHLVEMADDGNHRLVASAIPVPESSIVGYGTYFGGPVVAYDEATAVAFYQSSLTTAAVIDGEYIMVANGRPVRGLDANSVQITGTYGGRVYGIGEDASGNRVLVEARPTFAKPAPRIRDISWTPDGTLRLDVAHLTLGQSYSVEQFVHATGRWEAVGQFEPLRATRSVLATHKPGAEGFYRLR